MQTTSDWSARVRRAVALVGVSVVSVASIAVLTPSERPVEAVGSANSWLGYINEYRSESGLKAVAHETAWDQGTYNHSCYMNQNGLTHYEDPSKPGYTKSGAEAGTKSNVAGIFTGSGDKLADAKEAIDLWMAAPFHAIGMLRKNWASTSLGICYKGGSNPTYSATLDVLRGLSYGTGSAVFPGNGATTHLNRFRGESPDPTADCNKSSSWGLPLIAMFPNAATKATATVKGPNVTWTEPKLCVLDYEDVTDPVGSSIVQGSNAVIVIPPAQMPDGKYTVNVSAGGQSVNWSFTVKTGTATTTTTTTAPRPTTTAPRTTTTAPRTTTTAPRTTTTAPKPTTTAPKPTTTAPRTTTTVPRTTTTAMVLYFKPVATFNPGRDQTVSLGTTLTFDGSASRDPDGGPITYEWRSTGLNGVVSRTNSFRRTFSSVGRHGVELTVTDDEGAVSTRHINVWVTQPPVATFTPGTDQQVAPGTTLTFDGSRSNDPDGGPLSYEWRSTGLNGVVATTNSYTRKFTEPGRWGVQLTVVDDEGQASKQHINVWVVVPPVATFTPGTDQQVAPGTTLTFDGSRSNDPDGGPIRYEWRSTGLNGVVASGNSYTRKFTEPGRWGVELTIIDDEGQASKQHINVWVVLPPVATFTPGSDQNVKVGTTLTFDGSRSNDPDGGSISYEWRSTGLNGVVAKSSSYTRKFTAPGRWGVELTVIDDEGQVSKQHINVWVK